MPEGVGHGKGIIGNTRGALLYSVNKARSDHHVCGGMPRAVGTNAAGRLAPLVFDPKYKSYLFGQKSNNHTFLGCVGEKHCATLPSSVEFHKDAHISAIELHFFLLCFGAPWRKLQKLNLLKGTVHAHACSDH